MGGLVGAVFGAGLLIVVRRLPFLRKPTADERISPYLRDLGGPEVFVGVVAPINPRVETPEEVRDRVLEAVRYIPITQLGTTDDCGFSPFSDDTSTTRETAFAKIRARVSGTAMAAQVLGKSR